MRLLMLLSSQQLLSKCMVTITQTITKGSRTVVSSSDKTSSAGIVAARLSQFRYRHPWSCIVLETIIASASTTPINEHPRFELLSEVAPSVRKHVGTIWCEYSSHWYDHRVVPKAPPCTDTGTSITSISSPFSISRMDFSFNCLSDRYETNKTFKQAKS